MAAPLTLLLVRHGQSEWNAAGRMQGQTAHVPLTALGHEQAAAAARELAALRPGALISSDLHRAVQTAEHCARATGLPVTTTPALREQGYGVLERRPSRELWASLTFGSMSRLHLSPGTVMEPMTIVQWSPEIGL